MRQFYRNEAQISDSMLPFLNTRYNLEQVAVSSTLPFNKLQDQLSALKKALIQNQSLNEFKEDPKVFDLSKSNLGWRDFLDISSRMREALMLLEIKEWSTPVFVNNKYYFFKILEKEKLKTKIDINNKDIIANF